MNALEIIYDHYKETYKISKEAQTRRNKSFVLLCILEAISFLLLIRPEKALEIFLTGINNELNITLELSNTILQTLLWILIAYVMIRYVQDMLYIEKGYKYLEILEKEIGKEVKGFTREGENYLENYPMVLNFIDLFYKMLMPVIFIGINGARIYREWIFLDKTIIALLCDTILFMAIFIITWFYFFEIHSKITEFFKKNIPIINFLAKKLRNLLKGV